VQVPPRQEVDFGGYDGLVLVQEGGVMHAVDLKDLTGGGGGLSSAAGAARTVGSSVLTIASSGQRCAADECAGFVDQLGPSS
jgi:hypothetical protein